MSQNIFVTGTNSGFGSLIAKTLADSGHHVFATMRDIRGRNADNATRLEELGQGRIDVVEMTLADDRSVADAASVALDKAGHIDVVVNNAGYATMGLEETLTSAQMLALYDINVVGPHRVMRAFLPSMRERRAGLVVQISSGLGRLTFPIMGAYCSSKSALEALSEAYRYGLKPTGVEVTMVQPGAFPTDFGRRLVVGAEQERAQGYGPLADGLEMMSKSFEAMFAGADTPDPQQVADAVLGLVNTPAGTRPSRVVVDNMSGQMTESLNQSHAEVQKTALGLFGMTALAD